MNKPKLIFSKKMKNNKEYQKIRNTNKNYLLENQCQITKSTYKK